LFDLKGRVALVTGATRGAHAGAGGDEEANRRGAPADLRALLDKFPALTLIACHYGGYHQISQAREHIVGSLAYLGTSWPPRLADVDPGELRSIIAAHGPDRVVFGSDWPMNDPAAEISAIPAIGLPGAQQEAVLGGTFARLLRIGSNTNIDSNVKGQRR
jgi:predicted TIM-barrel fold metal-dependent hydrolase